MKIKVYKDTSLFIESELVGIPIPKIDDTITIGYGSYTVEYVVVGLMPMWNDGYVIVFVR